MKKTDIEVLHNFVGIIESGSITAASKKLYVTQAALSMQLKNLEKELGAVLLIRSAHGLALTEAGKALYRRAKSISAAADSMKSEIAAIENGESGRIRLALLSSEGISSAADIIRDFCGKYPDVKLEIFEGNEREVIELLTTGAAGAAILRTPCTLSSDMDIIKLKSEEMAAVYRSGEYPAEADIMFLSSKRITVMRKYQGLFGKLFSEKAHKNRQFSAPVTVSSSDSAEAAIKCALYTSSFGIVPLSAAIDSGEKYIILREDSLITERLLVSAGGNTKGAAEKLFADHAALFSKQISQTSAPAK